RATTGFQSSNRWITRLLLPGRTRLSQTGVANSPLDRPAPPGPRRPDSPSLSTGSTENRILTIPSSHRIFLTRRLYSCQNPNSQEYDRARHDPVYGHVNQVCGINQADDYDRKSTRVKTE